jgi:hypothetical protein
MVRVISDQVIDITRMRPGQIAVVCGDDGLIDETRVTELEDDAQRAGTTMALLVADAWKISSEKYKDALTSALGERQAIEAGARDLINKIVRSWAQGMGRSYAGGEAGVGGGRRGTAGQQPVDSESFDFVASACLRFIRDPDAFGHTKGSAKHAEAVKVIRPPLQAALECEVGGPWSMAATTAGDSDEEEDPERAAAAAGDMTTRKVYALLKECHAALMIRQLRNQSAAHPLRSSDPETRERMLQLFRRAVAERAPLLSGFKTLAKAAVGHVELSHAALARREAGAGAGETVV